MRVIDWIEQASEEERRLMARELTRMRAKDRADYLLRVYRNTIDGRETRCGYEVMNALYCRSELERMALTDSQTALLESADQAYRAASEDVADIVACDVDLDAWVQDNGLTDWWFTILCG